MEKIMQIGAGQSLAMSASYVAVMLVLAVVLSARVVSVRRSARIGLGDGENRDLLRRIRAHGNFSEYAPMLMLVLLALPLLGAREWTIHAVGVPALVGRGIHAIGLSRSGGASSARVGGMMLTYLALLIGAAALLVLAWS